MLRFSTYLLVVFSLAVPHFVLAQAATTPPPAAASSAPMVQMMPNSFADLADSVTSAVVNISTTQKAPAQGMGHPGVGPQGVPFPEFPPGSPFQDFFDDFFNNQMGAPNMGGGEDAPANAPRAQSLGSGFIVDAAKGYVVTNNHVIDDAAEIKVILHNDVQLDAKLVGRDPKTDLALLQVKADGQLKAVKWGNSDQARVGDWVMAVGNPFGLGGSVTAGIISARQRKINAGNYDDFIQTDAPINRGNSGGPLFNLKGEVIGINTAIYSPTGGSVGIGFAVPSSLAQPVINQLLEFGHTKRGWLGVRIQEVTPEIADSLGLKAPTGALVASVTPQSPADKIGVKAGDVITSFNGKKIGKMYELPRIVAEAQIGQTVPLEVWQKGVAATKQVLIGRLEDAEKAGLLSDTKHANPKQAPSATQAQKIAPLGLTVAPLDAVAYRRYSIAPTVKGVVIVDIDGNSDAADKGLMPGDVVLEVNQQPIADVTALKAAIDVAAKTGKGSVLLLLNAQDDLRFVALKLQAAKK